MIWIAFVVALGLLIVYMKLAVDQEVRYQEARAHQEEKQAHRSLSEQRSRVLSLQNELAQLDRQLRS